MRKFSISQERTIGRESLSNLDVGHLASTGRESLGVCWPLVSGISIKSEPGWGYKDNMRRLECDESHCDS